MAMRLGNLSFAFKTRRLLLTPLADRIPVLFLQHLKGKAPKEAFPKSLALQYGHQPVGRRFAAWPPTEAERPQSLYLQPDWQALLRSRGRPPVSTSTPAIRRNPVPVIWRESARGHAPPTTWTYDQRFASRRADVLTWQTAPARPRTSPLAGPVHTRAGESPTTGTDSDFCSEG